MNSRPTDQFSAAPLSNDRVSQLFDETFGAEARWLLVGAWASESHW